MARTAKGFVKSSDTTTPASNSRLQIDKMLRRYGASSISMSEDFERREIVVSFIVPDSKKPNAARVPVRLPVSIISVCAAMYGPAGRSGYSARMFEQCERVAWRNLVLWIDAALSAAAVGLQTITEAFFAHAVVGEGGQRMIDLVESMQSQLGSGVQRLLTSPAEIVD